MFKRLNIIMLLFKANWFCQVITKLVIGLSSSITILNYVINELDGSPLGEKINSYLTSMIDMAQSALKPLTTVSDLVCGKAVTEGVKAQSIESALADMQSATEDLKEL